MTKISDLIISVADLGDFNPSGADVVVMVTLLAEMVKYHNIIAAIQRERSCELGMTAGFFFRKQ